MIELDSVEEKGLFRKEWLEMQSTYNTRQKFGHTYSSIGLSLFFSILWNNTEDYEIMHMELCGY